MKKVKYREISPAVGITVKQLVKTLPPDLAAFLRKIRKQKRKGARPKPSSNLIDESKITTPEYRRKLIDKVCALIDERLFGRHEMCKQCAVLLERSLISLGYEAKAVIGIATYSSGFEWEHSWVVVQGEVIDVNADSMIENPHVPKGTNPRSYWGVADKLPSDRNFTVTTDEHEWDPDIEEYWWPELKDWLSRNKPK
ncbi:MAG: hypothetical protein CL866_02035 [Cycloclasticus sp.]|nr:hypothetical protein [Cycloclasticus sp.]MBG95639.1 hypothetical protein [Cycloclasticus sp.]